MNKKNTWKNWKVQYTKKNSKKDSIVRSRKHPEREEYVRTEEKVISTIK